MTTETLQVGEFDPAEFQEELASAPSNTAVGTSSLLQNASVRVWEVRLAPGERTPFHAHTTRYFWTCVDAGIGRQRDADGTMKLFRYHAGDTRYSEHTSDDPMVHDLENAGDTVLRFVTVELL
jgi:hypothetical protein